MNRTNKYSSTNINKYQCNHPFVVNRIANFFQNLLKLIVLLKPFNILNIGCGEGFDIKNIYQKGKMNFECCCMDLNFDALKMTKKLLCHLPFHAINGDIYYLPFKLDSFDLILCLEVLEHLAFPEKALDELSRHFNGHCIFSVPNEPLYRLTRMLLFRQNVRQFGDHPEHLNHWSKNKFARLIKKYFIIDQIITPFPWTIVLCHKKTHLTK